MKKMVMIIALLTITALTLTGCGENKENKETVKNQMTSAVEEIVVKPIIVNPIEVEHIETETILAETILTETIIEENVITWDNNDNIKTW